jgi:heptosyltransferase-2
VKDFVWLSTGFLGDMVLITGAYQLAKSKWPQARHHLISTGLGCEALKNEGFDSYVTFHKGSNISFLSEIQRIRRTIRTSITDPQHSITLQIHRSYRSGFLAIGLGLPTVAFTQTDFNPLAKIKVDRVAVFHEAIRNALLLEPLGVGRDEIVKAKPKLQPVASCSSAWSADFLKLQGRMSRVIGVAPGSTWGTKKWPKESYLELCQKILATDGHGLVLLGSQAEQPDADSIEQTLAQPDRCLNLAGKTSLEDLGWVYPKLDSVICNDSSAVHYGSAYNVPTIAIFGATVPEMGFGPLAERSETVEIDLICRPCSDHGPQTCPLGHFKCMRQLAVAQVFAALTKALA